MAQKVNIVLEDDLDGSEAAETVTYSLDGIGYEIDLNEKNAAALRKSLAKFIEKSRRTGKVAGGKPSKRQQSGPNPREVRDWARSHGIEVPDRGRIPADVVEKFNADKA